MTGVEAGAQQETLQHVDPRSISVWRIGSAISFTPPLVALCVAATAAGIAGSPAAWGLGVVFIALLAAAAVHVLKYAPARYRHLRYRADAVGIMVEDGIFFRTQSAVPRVRIQHTDVAQGPLERRYGVATLKLYTAGSRFTKVELPGLRYEIAVELRDRLQQTGTGDAV